MYTLRLILLICLLFLFAAPSDAKIVFSSSHNGRGNIYVMDDNGQNMRQITDTPYYDKSPYWSPNGKRIAFFRNTTLPDQEGSTNVYVMNADGSNIQQLTIMDVRMIDLAISPNGKKIVFTQGLSDQRVIDLDTGEVKQISRSHINHLDWSPDGNTIIYVNDDHQFFGKHLWMMDANGDNPRQWTKPRGEDIMPYHYYPRWSQDGKQILYCISEWIQLVREIKGVLVNNGWGVGLFQYIIQNIDGDEIQRLDIPDNWYCTSLAWIHEERSVLFSAFEYERGSNRQNIRQIYKYDLSSNQFTHLTEGSGADWYEGALSVSPIGKKSMRWSELKKAYTDR